MKKTVIGVFFSTILLTTIANAQQLIIYTEEFPPFNFIEKGKVTGVSAEVVNRVMKATGMEYTIKSLPWTQAYNLAQNEKNALIFSIGRNKNREHLFKWIGILTPTTYSAMALKSRKDIKISSLDNMKKFKIGTTIDDLVESWLFEKGFSASELARSSGDNAALKNFKNLLNKRIDIWPFPDAVAFYIVRKQGHTNPDALLQKVFTIDELSGGYYIASSKKTSDSIVLKVSRALTQFKQTDDYFKILAHWGVDAMAIKTDAPIAKLIYAFKNLNRIVTVGYLATDKLSAHRHGGQYRKEMHEQFIEAYVSTFDQWLDKYVKLQSQVDAPLIGDIKGIKHWDDETAQQITQSETKIPTGCVNGKLAQFALFGYEEDDFIINKKIAQKLNVTLPKSYMSKAAKIIE
jgi:polar amino acid transport system substrate-binding protein